MSSKRKKVPVSYPRHKYTTKEIMEITEQRRLKMQAAEKEAADKAAELKTKVPNDEPTVKEDDRESPVLPVPQTPGTNEEIEMSAVDISQGAPENKSAEMDVSREIPGPTEEIKEGEVDTPEVNEEVKMPDSDVPLFKPEEELKPAGVFVPRISEENKVAATYTFRTNEEVPSSTVPNPLKTYLTPDSPVTGVVIFILSLTISLLVFSLKFSQSWVSVLSAGLNSLVVYGSFFFLRIMQGPCGVDGLILKTHYYQVSLQGDLVGLYSLELLIVFASFLAFIQKIDFLKRGMVFISLVPLAVIANIIRVLWACGLALNYGTVFADRYFHGALVCFVFIFIFSGLIFFEFLFSSD